MIDVEAFELRQITLSMGCVAKATIAQGEHVEAMDAVSGIERAIPDEQVGQGYGEIVHRDVVEDVLLAVADETIEEPASLVFLS